jgi:hypothetical protein
MVALHVFQTNDWITQIKGRTNESLNTIFSFRKPIVFIDRDQILSRI